MKKYLIALGVAFFIIAGVFVLEHSMRRLANEWAGLGVEISISDRILFGVAALWSRFWFLLSPVILAACMGIAVLTDLLRPQRP